MNIPRFVIAASFATLVAVPAFAQTGEGNCLLAGRLSMEQQWAPRFAGVQLLGQDGKAISAADKQALSNVRRVRLTQSALLSRCDGDREIALGDESPGPKTKVPAAKAGPGLLAVESVNFPKMRRGGELVELKVKVPADRVVMLSR
jgi:hypothetical protein